MTKSIEVRQVLLRSDNREMIIWANTTKKFAVGNSLTLKNSSEPNRLWQVVEIYGSQNLADIHNDWKVGGL